MSGGILRGVPTRRVRRLRQTPRAPATKIGMTPHRRDGRKRKRKPRQRGDAQTQAWAGDRTIHAPSSQPGRRRNVGWFGLAVFTAVTGCGRSNHPVATKSELEAFLKEHPMEADEFGNDGSGVPMETAEPSPDDGRAESGPGSST